MNGKMSRSLFSLALAFCFLLQTVSIVAFADDEAVAEPEEQEVSFSIDENGEYVELDDDFDYEEETGSGFEELDSDAFFDYSGDVSVFEADVTKGVLKASANFQNSTVGATEVEGWTLKSVPKANQQLSTIKVVSDSEKGNVLELDKVTNGAKNSTFDAGDERVSANFAYPEGLSGKVAVVAEVKMTQPGRLGMYTFSSYEESTNTPVYNARLYMWDDAGSSKDPSTVKSLRYTAYDVTSGKESKAESTGGKSKDTSAKMEANTWYKWTFDMDFENGTYDIYINDKCQFQGLAIYQPALGFGGVGFEIQNDVKSLGRLEVGSVAIYDMNSAAANDQAAAADAAALTLGIDANVVTENFTVATSGQYNNSTITWTSSNSSIASVNNSNGNVTINRPSYSGAEKVSVTLTATVQFEGSVVTRDFTIVVYEQPPTTDRDKAQVDANSLELPSTAIGTLTSGFTLPTLGSVSGSTITWESSNSTVASVNSSTGEVTITRPAFSGTGTTSVTLTATVKSGSASVNKTFVITVAQLDPATDGEKAQHVASTLIIGGIDTDNIKLDSFYLPDSSNYNSSISWTSSNEKYVKIENNYETNEETGNVTQIPGYTAVVNRPDRSAAAVTVTLTAVINVNGATATKDFVLEIQPEDALKAYPGVEGYGAYSTGGRGGMVYHVTNLNATGEGSLAYGIEELKGPRTIVFDVAGVIDLTKRGSGIRFKGEKGSNITVAGQTAPFPGIELKGYGITLSNVHDVVIRHLRIRIGDTYDDGEVYQEDPMSIGNSRNVVVDHCTMQWAIDMCFRATGKDVTLSNIIFGKSLLENSPHEKGGHAYVGMINEGASKISFIKNFIGDSTQRSPRITDADWIDAYNNVLFNSGNGFDIFNYEWQGKNSKMNIYNNYARKGPNVSNATPYRAGRGRNYAGGVMVYFTGNYGKSSSDGLQSTATNYDGTFKKELKFGQANTSAGADYDLSNVTLDEWNTNPLSYDNGGKVKSAATLTYMDYPFPAPRGNVLSGDKDTMMNYVKNDRGDGQTMGASKPARDLYDLMVIQEARGGGSTTGTLDEQTVSDYFQKLEDRTGLDYSAYKTARNWTIRQGEGPVLSGAASSAGKTKPIYWDNYTDVNTKTNKTAKSKYKYTTDFEVGSSWWGEFAGYPGFEKTYSLSNGKNLVTYSERQLAVMGENAWADAVARGDYENTEENKAEFISAYWQSFNDTFGTSVSNDGVISESDPGIKGYDESYVTVYRTVADLYPESYGKNFKNDYPAEAAAMENYRNQNYAGREKSYRIVWDTMNDGIPDWYKICKGWDTKQALNRKVDPETGYTYLELYLAFMAGDKELATDDTPASIENFKYSKLGYSTVQLFWNTDYRASCVIEYGTQPRVYTHSVPLEYTDETDYYHTYHAVTLAELQPDTTYYYKVTAVDELSNVTVAEYNPSDSEEKKMTFTTTVAPDGAAGFVPSKPIITSTVPYLNQVRLNWNGDVSTDTGYEIYYDTKSHGGVIGEYPNSITGLSGQTYNQVVTGLTNYTPYYFVVVATNANGKTTSDEVEIIPSGTVINCNFNEMTAAERSEFEKSQYMYNLGGSMSIQKDPDTGEYVLQMLDETNSHGVNTKWSFPVTQTDKFTTTVKFKILYQKQTDALNAQSNVDTIAADEHNTFQFNFSMDANMNEEHDSTNAGLWDSAFNVYFDSRSNALTTTPGGRYDGTKETGTITFSNKAVGTYNSGLTTTAAAGGVLPTGTGYSSSTYKNTTVYGDAKYSNIADTDKTLHGLWYYEPNSAKFMTLKVVTDLDQGNVKVYLDDKLVYAQGEFNEDLEKPYNIGRFEMKSRNDGYSWINVASISVVGGDESDSAGGTVNGNGNGSSSSVVVPVDKGGGGSVGPVVNPNPTDSTADPNTSTDPNASTNPDTSANPNTPITSADDLTDLDGVEWAVEAIDALIGRGIVTGNGDGTFEPEREITRAEYISMLMRAIPDMEVDTSAVEAFTDVSNSDWYSDTIYRAAALGIVNGVGDGSFGVEASISREDMMVMAYRFISVTGMEIEAVRDAEDFADRADISDYAGEAIEKMYCAGIINGMGEGKLEPKGVANRAQAAKIIYGILGGNNDEK